MKETQMHSSSSFHPELLAAQNLIYAPSSLVVHNFMREVESAEYEACTFEMGDLRIKFRVGKITPTKSGQFVTFWKRNAEGIIIPHDVTDAFDFWVVSARQADHFGQFVFPKAVLASKGIISKAGQGGKLGIRIYPPWDNASSPQAKKTQTWQCQYFVEMPLQGSVDMARVQTLFNATKNLFRDY